MFKPLKILVFLIVCLSSTLAFSQSIDGLQEIVKLQQDKISSIEDNLKKLIGSVEEQSNLNKSSNNSKLIDDKINDINQKLRLLENNMKNFNIGLELIECWANDLRNHHYTNNIVTKKRLDLFIGLKFEWIVPLKKRTTSNYYYY